MIGALRSEMERGALFVFCEGLGAWMRGEDSDEADAAGQVIAETVLLHRAWLLAHKTEK